MTSMFENNPNLAHIYVSAANWKTDKVTDSTNMFKGATKLPHFNSSNLDVSRANTTSTGYLENKAQPGADHDCSE